MTNYTTIKASRLGVHIREDEDSAPSTIAKVTRNVANTGAADNRTTMPKGGYRYGISNPALRPVVSD